MKRIIVMLVCSGVLFCAGCSSNDPVALAKDYVAAMKTHDANKIAAIDEQVRRLSDADKEKFSQELLKEMFGNMGDMFKQGMGDMMKGFGDMPKFDMPKFEMPKFEMPKFEMPKFEPPKFEFPK